MKHYHAVHPDKVKEWGEKGIATITTNRGKKEKNPDSSIKQTSTQIATAVAPKPAAVVFTLGKLNIEIDPQELYEAFMIYQDIKKKCSLQSSFSEAINDAMSICWKLMIPVVPHDGHDGDAHNLEQTKIVIEQAGG